VQAWTSPQLQITWEKEKDDATQEIIATAAAPQTARSCA